MVGIPGKLYLLATGRSAGATLRRRSMPSETDTLQGGIRAVAREARVNKKNPASPARRGN